MTFSRKTINWLLWLTMTTVLTGYSCYILFVSDDKSELLIGETSHGHYQIEMACSSCHTEAFGGPDLIQEACTNCHQEELDNAHDSHPKKKFTDPREAFRLETIDARYCISCHTEHQPEQTHAMGVTLPDDYCFHCHAEVIDERESHKGLAFDSCASAGCHNFHDNRALYEDFLVANANQVWLKDLAKITAANFAHHTAPSHPAPSHTSPSHIEQKQSAAIANDGHSQLDQQKMQQHPDIYQQWQHSAHAEGKVSCSGCHAANQEKDSDWIERPGLKQCQQCHQQEADGFLAGKHGMRLAANISAPLLPITPQESPLHFKESSLNAQHGCNSCHQSHTYDTQFAAVEACLQCHNDEHSKNFMQSPHGTLWELAQNTGLPHENSVSCATCHLPRLHKDISGTNIVSDNTKVKSRDNKKIEIVSVEHNQNLFLRPNEKMIRPICMQCHSLEFSIDALADPELIINNFSGKPSKHIPSIDWALDRVKD